MHRTFVACLLLALAAVALGDVQCSSTSSCPDGDTCCQTSTGGWGCCPSPNATCCSDHIHCCPHDYPVCNVKSGQCLSSFDEGAKSVEWLTKRDTLKPVKDVQCSSTSSCPDGDTCCQTSTGGYGCCPSPNATCCSDHIHCCPHDYPVCDVKSGQCLSSAEANAKSVEWLSNDDVTFAPFEPIIELPVKDVQCSSTSSCPDGDTCCQTSTGGYGCCPSPNATCCSDHIHCCPHDYPVCDVKSGQCLSSADIDAESVPMMESEDLMWDMFEPIIASPPEDDDAKSSPVKDVQCSSTSSCPDGDTCCQTSTGGYGCCPSPNATCCSDHIHCCPHDYPVCDVKSGQCLSSADIDAFAVPMLVNEPVKSDE